MADVHFLNWLMLVPMLVCQDPLLLVHSRMHAVSYFLICLACSHPRLLVLRARRMKFTSTKDAGNILSLSKTSILETPQTLTMLQDGSTFSCLNAYLTVNRKWCTETCTVQKKDLRIHKRSCEAQTKQRPAPWQEFGFQVLEHKTSLIWMLSEGLTFLLTFGPAGSDVCSDIEKDMQNANSQLFWCIGWQILTYSLAHRVTHVPHFGWHARRSMYIYI